MTRRPTRTALRRALHLRRRPLAAACTFLAVLATLLALAPGPDAGVRVYAALAALPAGTVLGADHLIPLDLPPGAVPEGAARSPADVVGRTLFAPVTARSVLTTASVSAGGRLARPGFLVVALPLPGDGIAALVRPGVRIDVLDAEGRLVAGDLAVVSPPEEATVGSGLGAASRSALVEVPAEVATRLASSAQTGLTIAVR